MKRPNVQQVVTFALLVHDLSWITLRPEFGIPAMALGLSLQTSLTVSSLRARSSELYCNAALLFWLLGNVIWTMAEYIWDSGYPVGFLANVKCITDLWAASQWYAVMMYSAITVQTFTCAALIAFYVSRWARWRRLHAVNPAVPLMGSPAQVNAVVGFAAPLSPVEAYVLVPWLPLRMYYELFTLPWILMDTLWSYFDLQDIVHAHPGPILLVFSAFFGVAAIAICVDCVRRLAAARQRSDALLAMAEAFWVTGNVVWMLEDSLNLWYAMKVIAVTFFATGPFLIICSVFFNVDASDPGCIEDVRSIVVSSEGSLEAGISTSFVVADAVKKKRHSARSSRRGSRLMKHVTVLPKDLSTKTPNFAQLVARLAVNALSEQEKSITVFDLGHVSKRLSEWRKLMPRVSAHYTVSSHSNKKVLQLLCQSRCSFACATAEEVSRVLSLGAPPELVVFCEARKIKTHLNYVKEKGVQLMHFDDPAELRKIAAEYPGAQLLLQLAPHKRMLPVQFGAARTDWAPLLALAAELGLRVVGVSLRGPGCEEWSVSDDCLRDVHDVFRLATERGHSMEVLDLGGVDTLHGMAFCDVASTIQEQLSRWFPTEAFSKLRVIASPGQLFTRNASMLLTRVIAKENLTSDRGVEAIGTSDSPYLQYVLNEGLYGAFASLLTHRSQPEPPTAIALGAHARPERRCCFLGPSRDQLDVVLKEATLPELEEGEWVIWQRLQTATRSWASDDADDNEIQQSRVWYYAEDGNLPEEAPQR